MVRQRERRVQQDRRQRDKDRSLLLIALGARDINAMQRRYEEERLLWFLTLIGSSSSLHLQHASREDGALKDSPTRARCTSDRHQFLSYNTLLHTQYTLFMFINHYLSLMNCITFGRLQSNYSLVLSIWRKPLSLRNDNDNDNDNTIRKT